MGILDKLPQPGSKGILTCLSVTWLGEQTNPGVVCPPGRADVPDVSEEGHHWVAKASAGSRQ